MNRIELNVFACELSEACRNQPLKEKWLLAPSLRIGYQWLDTVSRAGHPVLNARLKTLQHLALELAAPEIEKKGMTMLRGLREEVVIAGTFSSLKKRSKSKGYLSQLEPGPGLTHALRFTLRDLRLSGLSSRQLKKGAFEVEAKGSEISSLLATFEKTLEDESLIDYAGVLILATERLHSDPAALPQDARLLVPADLVEGLTGLEAELWESIPAEKRIVLQVDQPSAMPEGEKPADVLNLRFLSDPPSAPPPIKDDTVKIFRATGEVNEVREVLRRCVEQAIPFDQVELLHTDTETYVPLIFEIVSRLEHASDESIPATFAEGIPIRYARPARALAGWLAWLRDDYAQSTLVRMVQDGLIEAGPAADEGFSFTRLGAMLKSLPIGSGRMRYLQVIDDELSRASARIASFEPDREDEEDPERAERRLMALRGRERGLQIVRSLVEGLPALHSKDPGSTGLLDAAAAFLNENTRCISRFDAYARRLLLDLVGEMRLCINNKVDVDGLDVRAWLEGLPSSTRVGGLGPRPGCIFVNHVLGGGHSGRPYTFIVGLDDSRFPGAGSLDPLLLDSERARISDHLPTASARLARKEEQFAGLTARLRGNITLCYSCRDLADDREKFPSPSLISAWRAVTGEIEGDQASLAAWLPPPVSFSPDHPDRCIDATEWWLWRMCESAPVSDPRSLVSGCFPHLGRGFIAHDARRSAVFTEYDGCVPEAGQPCDTCPGENQVLSASRLETLGKNPLEYFFRYVLGIAPPEEFTLDPATWLDPLEQGKLLHDVFHGFMSRLRAEGRLPERVRDIALLEDILKVEVERMLQLKPAPNPDTLNAEFRELRRTARIFLASEEEFCLDSIPVFLETSIGMAQDGLGTPLDTPDPLLISPAKGVSILARGRIDRVDDISSGALTAFTIWDYKTGSDSRYDLLDPFRQGRCVQPLLYLELVREQLRSVYPEARVAGFGYFFPGRRASRERYYWGARELENGRSVLARLCEMLATGCFPFTDDAKDARYGDYLDAFGDITAAVEDIARKLDNPDNTELEPFRQLRRAD